MSEHPSAAMAKVMEHLLGAMFVENAKSHLHQCRGCSGLRKKACL
jgi:hypothetical protein